MKCFARLFVCSLVTLLSSSFFCHGNVINEKVLHVGEELFKETLPLQNGARLYHLQGLKPQMWYEVKISYPASGEMSVLVNLEPEGVVAIPGKQEREYAVFNIVCDELLLGIPHEAWYVVVLVLLCLVLAFMVPSFLPAFLLPENGRQPLFDHTVTKAS